MKRKFVVFGIISASLLVLFGIFLSYDQIVSTISSSSSTANSQTAESKVSEPVKITYENIEDQIEKSEMVMSLPEKSSIVLRFYNFDSGEREWERSYLIKRSEAEEISEIPETDIIIFIHSKYLEELTSKNFCTVIQKANQNGDLGTESELSEVRLLWKFKSMLKYRDCLNL